MQENRNDRRQRALKAGRIVFNNRFSAMDCTVRNLSPSGAMLLIAGPQGIPDAFELELDAGTVTHICKVMWRKEDRLGVRFA
jgi:hypothetical protein